MRRSKNNISKLSSLIIKRFLGVVSDNEKEEVDSYLEDSSLLSNGNKFKEDKFIVENINRKCRFDYKPAFEDFYKTTSNKRKLRVIRRLRIASVVMLPILLTGLGYWIVSTKIKSTDNLAVEEAIVPGRSQAYLTLANGENLNLDTLKQELKEKDGTILFPVSGKIAYRQSDSSVNKELVYNTLNVPRGGEYKLQLSDGTHMWVNSDSKVRFPVSFTGGSRNIFVSGEVFLKVAKDKTKPFIVHTSKGKVKVLGTSFNVRDYRDEDIVATTLVEGSVEFVSSKGIVKIEPGEQVRNLGRYDELEVKKVNVKDYISWKDGIFVFNHSRLDDIMKTMERWYDVDVFFLNEEIKSLRFSGELERYDDINKLLDFLKTGGDVRFKIKGKTITVIKK